MKFKRLIKNTALPLLVFYLLLPTSFASNANYISKDTILNKLDEIRATYAERIDSINLESFCLAFSNNIEGPTDPNHLLQLVLSEKFDNELDELEVVKQ